MIWTFSIFRKIRSLTNQWALALLLAIQQLEKAAAFDVASCTRRLASVKEYDLVCWICRLDGIAACLLPHIRSDLSFLIGTQQAESELRLSFGRVSETCTQTHVGIPQRQTGVPFRAPFAIGW